MTFKLTVYGLVQGVGFRPYVQRVARLFDLVGNVRNIGGIAEIFINADNKILDGFVQYLISNRPQGCEIYKIKTEEYPKQDFNSFEIINSQGCDVIPIIPADIGICDKCLEEFNDPKNPRYNHPFISCVSCGPRYSIIKNLPYDRENITMDIFPLCNDCKREYNNADDRRCYAQTIACNHCGPVLKYTKEGNPIDMAIDDIKNGKVVAVRDIGGYHFVCSALNSKAVDTLRNLKIREEKPFAVMFNTIDEIKDYALVSQMEADALNSDAKPIVLVDKNYNNSFPENVCGNSNSIGAFLPCNAVQYTLTKQCGPLVMTSGNISGEPVITSNKAMLEIHKSSPYLEGVLYHERDILTPLDDSIVRIIDDGLQIVRRGRGYTPLPVWLEESTEDKIFASGGDLKSSFCLLAQNRAYMSQYFGDLENADSLKAYKEKTDRMCRMLNIKADKFVCDLHPAYYSTQYTKALCENVDYVQHHIAHVASVIAEHSIKGDVLGLAFDGTGYGTDGTVWGGEVFEYKNGEFLRKFHLKPVKMVGGNEISKNAKTVLNCYLQDAEIDIDDVLIKSALENNINTIYSSSMGRLFDAVSAMLGICEYNTYEGKCAAMLEMEALKAQRPYPLTLPLIDGMWDTASLIKQIYLAKGDAGEIALGFHYAIANAVVNVCDSVKIKNIALSGGVFMNRILTELCVDKLRKKGYNVYINRQVPTNDGGIALGQAYVLLKR